MSKNEQLISEIEALAKQIEEWRLDDEAGPACIDLTCEAEELLLKAAAALRASA